MQIGVPNSSSREWHDHWPVILPSTAGIMLCAVHSYSLGVMISPLEKAYGWTRAEISTGPLIIAVMALFGAPLVGAAVDRFGPRRIGLLGAPFFCTMLACLSLATPNIWSWWALWAILGVSAMFVIPTIWTAAITSLFSKNRGSALAIALCGTSLCATTTPFLTNILVDAFGWRMAYVVLAVIYLAIALPLIWFFFRGARDKQREVQSDKPAQQGAHLPSGLTLKEGMASPAFMKLAGAILIYSLALCAMTTNSVPILIAQGLDRGGAAAVAGLIGIGSLIGRLVGGVLLDRLNANRVAAASVILPVISVLLLLAFPGSIQAAVAGCLILGLSVGTEIDACAYLSARHFGLRSFGVLFGRLNGLMLFANGLAPMIANHIYDVTRSYEVFLWAVIPACTLAAILFLALGQAPSETEPVTEN